MKNLSTSSRRASILFLGLSFGLTALRAWGAGSVVSTPSPKPAPRPIAAPSGSPLRASLPPPSSSPSSRPSGVPSGGPSSVPSSLPSGVPTPAFKTEVYTLDQRARVILVKAPMAAKGAKPNVATFLLPDPTAKLIATRDPKAPLLQAEFEGFLSPAGWQVVDPRKEKKTIIQNLSEKKIPAKELGSGAENQEGGKKELTGEVPVRAVKVQIQLVTKLTPITLALVSPQGSAETRIYNIYVPNFDDLLKDLKSPKKKNHTFIFGLGFTSEGFTQTVVGSVSQKDVSAKLGWNYSFQKEGYPSAWQIGLLGYGTLLPLSSTPTTSKMRFYGLNFRLTRMFHMSVKNTLGLSLGYYYAGMSTPTVQFGYRSLVGPQFFPSWRVQWSSRVDQNVYFKFSPISDKFGLLSLSNNEIAFGTSLGWLIKNGNPSKLNFSIDIASLKFSKNNATITNSSSTFSMGYSY